MISKAFEGTASTIIAAADFVANDAKTRDCPKGIVGKHARLSATVPPLITYIRYTVAMLTSRLL